MPEIPMIPIEAYGTGRVREPRGALLQGAIRLDATMPMQPFEMEIAVDTLCLDSTSFRQLVESNDRDAKRVAQAIASMSPSRQDVQPGDGLRGDSHRERSSGRFCLFQSARGWRPNCSARVIDACSTVARRGL